MKLICDQMLIRLGRWLRAAGYDTLIIQNSLTDKEILALAKKEKRILITRDRKIPNIDLQGIDWVLLHSNTTNDCAIELAKQLNINWQLNPFSRCLVCNNSLIKIDLPDSCLIPQNFQISDKDFWMCAKCKKVYWMGSHTKRMLNQLKAWQN